VWIHQFYHLDGKLKLRKPKDLPPASIRFDSPYDPKAHYSTKRQTHWTGYKVHLTETYDEDQPHLITHVETTIAPQSDADMTAPFHNALAEKDCLPETHLVDAGYVDAEQIVDSQERHQINLLGPVRPDVSWQTKENTGYAFQDFQIDWEAKTVTCPRGISSHRWAPMVDAWQNELIQVQFPRLLCRACTSRSLCTRSATEPRYLTLRQQAQHEALQYARREQQTEAWQKQYARRAGIEGTIWPKGGGVGGQRTA
jgi:transposase